MKLYILLFLLIVVRTHSCYSQDGSYQDELNKRLTEIRLRLESGIFVNRSESVETPCLCIDPNDNSKATPYGKFINSNYRIRLAKNSKIDSGVKCLNEHIARYLKFTVTKTGDTLSGTLKSTYSYPASSLIQYLGMTNNTGVYFDKLISSEGIFHLYAENDKYIIRVVLRNSPYDKRDTIYGSVEMVKGMYTGKEAFEIFFERMSYYKGNRNNQISLRFTSTSHSDEMEYYAVLVYNTLKYINSPDISKKAKAIWLRTFLSNPDCVACKPIFLSAESMIKLLKFSLPNTEPRPAH